MHRTQILLEQWQYDTLKAMSEHEGRSISAIVREALDRQLGGAGKRAKRGLETVEGIADSPASYGRDHDEVLYGKK